MPVSNRPWSEVSESDYADAGAFCSACLINLNTGPRSRWSKAKCKLPIKEPGGAINRAGVHAAAAALVGARGGVQAPTPEKKRAAKALVRIYRSDLKEDPPESLLRLAR